MSQSRSGGPRTFKGKQAARRNAVKHGLSATLLVPDRRDRIAELTSKYCTDRQDPKLWRLAGSVAEERVCLDAVETYKADLMMQSLADATENPQAPNSEALAVAVGSRIKLLNNLKRYERRARARWRKAVRALEQYEATKSANLSCD